MYCLCPATYARVSYGRKGCRPSSFFRPSYPVHSFALCMVLLEAFRVDMLVGAGGLREVVHFLQIGTLFWSLYRGVGDFQSLRHLVSLGTFRALPLLSHHMLGSISAHCWYLVARQLPGGGRTDRTSSSSPPQSLHWP